MELYRCSPPESWRSAIEIPPYIRIFRKENKSYLWCFVYNLSLSLSTHLLPFHDVMDTISHRISAAARHLSLLVEIPCAQR